MSFFDNLKKNSAESRLTEEMIYAQVLEEIQNGIRRDGLWAKALAESNMDENNAKARYLLLRVQSIKDEFEILERTTKISENSIKNKSTAEKTKRIDFSKGSLGNSIKPYTCMNCNRNQNMLIKRKSFHPIIWVLYVFFGGVLGIVVATLFSSIFNDTELTIFLGAFLPLASYIFIYFYFLRKTTLQCPTCGNLGDVN